MGTRPLLYLALLFGMGLIVYPLCADPRQAGVSTLIWLSLWAAPAGALASRSGLVGWVVPVAWLLALTPAIGGQLPGLEGVRFEWFYGGLALAGLFGVGWGVGRASVACSMTSAAVLLLCGLLLAALPALGGMGVAAPWSLAWTARFLDLSPASLVVESAGIDWMRHPAVYSPAGADSIDPLLRLPWVGMWAGPCALLLGCLASWLGIQWGTRSAV
ncbi:MAG TPA: hypothetical protein EYQ74_06810 [Planctomycetes bacterium]|nr:hypothetical protein [Planctomycetota bacterium]HIK59527.1 hypothetical protein [Planctomycetota bacterium]